MENEHRVVVGIDGSDASAVALDWALDAASRRGLPLDVVHAWEPHAALDAQAIPAQPAAAEVRAGANATMDEMLAAARARAGSWPVVRPLVVRGKAARTLEEMSADADLLVVGSHGLGPISTAVLGSVSGHCVNHATVPVTVVPHSRRPTAGDGRVVAGVDLTEPSYAALRWAVDEAGLRLAPLEVVHAVDVLPDAVGIAPRRDAEAERRPLIEDMVAGVLGCATRRPSSVEVLVPDGGPGHVLVEVATGASMLVVGAGRRSGLRHLLGSVSRHCLHHAPCPITVLREV